eukprot:3517572-Pyramimonas_sp.AAC.1
MYSFVCGLLRGGVRALAMTGTGGPYNKSDVVFTTRLFAAGGGGHRQLLERQLPGRASARGRHGRWQAHVRYCLRQPPLAGPGRAPHGR